jgi:hypothetical protein
VPKFRNVVVAAALCLSAAAAPQPYSIQLQDGAFRVAGWRASSVPAKGWTSVFAVYAGPGDVPALLGSYAVESGVLVFHPAFPLSPGVHYRAIFHPPGGAAVESTFDGPPRDTTRRTRVEHVYPSGDIIPANQLRLYLYFSSPMSRGEADRRVHVLDENGTALKGVFLPGEELWDPGFQRLTMTFDPGRIKRGLTSNMAMGSPITEGKRYTLVIDADWPDARGIPMVEAFRKPFRGGPAQRTAPDPTQWRITLPKAGSAGVLIVDFPSAMNYPLALRMIQVAGGQGSVPGAVELERQETRWRFTPTSLWKPGDYRLIVDSRIEDVAGNHIGQLFDTDMSARPSESSTPKTVSLNFQVH